MFVRTFMGIFEVKKVEEGNNRIFGKGTNMRINGRNLFTVLGALVSKVLFKSVGDSSLKRFTPDSPECPMEVFVNDRPIHPCDRVIGHPCEGKTIWGHVREMVFDSPNGLSFRYVWHSGLVRWERLDREKAVNP